MTTGCNKIPAMSPPDFTILGAWRYEPFGGYPYMHMKHVFAYKSHT